MERNPYAPKLEDMPGTIPVFPLAGVLLLPSGNLPLHIFEPRYRRMTEDAIKSHRMIGMIQPKISDDANPPLYDVGCAGKITDFHELPDGRFMMTLTGISRFRIIEELKTATPYRQIKPDWSFFEKDVEGVGCLNLDREKLHRMLGDFFKAHEFDCDWQKIQEATDGKLITCLSMICPFEASEKQALLEAPCCKTRAGVFMTMLEMAVVGGKSPSNCNEKH
jgi:Lon protease-like protein